MTMRTLLWLDDVRNPEDGWVREHRPEFSIQQVVWVKDYNQFVKWIKANGLPTCIGFDHDLGKKMTGADAAELIANYCVDRMEEVPDYFVQSANPVGRANIISKLECAKRFIKSNQPIKQQ